VVGQEVIIDAGTSLAEVNVIVGFGSVLLKYPLKFDHGVGATVTANVITITSTLPPSSGTTPVIMFLCIGIGALVLIAGVFLCLARKGMLPCCKCGGGKTGSPSSAGVPAATPHTKVYGNTSSNTLFQSTQEDLENGKPAAPKMSPLYTGDASHAEDRWPPIAVSPEDAVAMVSFNEASAGEEARVLAKFLTTRGVPTFCTGVYCPANPGDDWQVVTNLGIHHAQNLVMLVTPGWLESNNCQEEAKTFMNLRKDTENHAGKQIIPVNFPGITMKDYQNPKKCLFNLQTIQHISQASNTWMDDVLRAIRQ